MTPGPGRDAAPSPERARPHHPGGGRSRLRGRRKPGRNTPAGLPSSSMSVL
ncbi:hypothetical protein SFR_2061 [Streptomyces sp. FR-008]|nr:hypothetical protein SFR_2061 [Streptomyces sp. FR-008]